MWCILSRILTIACLFLVARAFYQIYKAKKNRGKANVLGSFGLMNFKVLSRKRFKFIPKWFYKETKGEKTNKPSFNKSKNYKKAELEMELRTAIRKENYEMAGEIQTKLDNINRYKK